MALQALVKNYGECVSSKILNNTNMFEFYTKLRNLAFFTGLLSYLLNSWSPQTKTAVDPAE